MKKTNKKQFKSVKPPSAIAAAVDIFNEQDRNIAKAQDLKDKVASKIRRYAYSVALKIGSLENLEIKGNKGCVSIIHRDAYSCKDPKKLKETLKSFDLKVSQFVSIKKEISFNFSSMKKSERDALFSFIKKEFGPVRFMQLVKQTERVEIKNLKEQMAEVAEDMDEFEELKEASGMYDAAISRKRVK